MIDGEGKKHTKPDFVKKTHPVSEIFQNPEIIEWEKIKTEIDIKEIKSAMHQVRLKYKVTERETGQETIFEGNATFSLIYDQYDFWTITNFKIPGLAF